MICVAVLDKHSQIFKEILRIGTCWYFYTVSTPLMIHFKRVIFFLLYNNKVNATIYINE